MSPMAIHVCFKKYPVYTLGHRSTHHPRLQTHAGEASLSKLCIHILAGQEELGPSAVGQAACLLLFLHRLSALHHDEVPAPLRLDWLTPVGRIARTHRTRCQHESACAAQGDTVTAREVARTANRPPCIRAPPSRSPDRARLDSSTRGAHAHQPCPPSGERPPR